MAFHSTKNPFLTEFGGGANQNLLVTDATRPNQAQIVQYIIMGPPADNKNKEISTSSNVVRKSQPEMHYIPTEESKMMNEPTDISSNAVYKKLETTVTFGEDEKGRGSYHGGNEYLVEDSVTETFLVFVTSIFNFSFSIGIAAWHCSDGSEDKARATLLLFFFSVILVYLAYAFNKSIRKADIWKGSKIFGILSFIPGILAILSSFADLIFAIREAHNRIYVRPWKNSRMIYLAESLALAVPQTVLQSVFLLQDPDSIPKIKGLFVLFSLGAMTMGIALARVRYDTTRRPDRFGSGLDKIIRSSIVWGNKGLWVTTLAILVVTVQLTYPNHSTIATVMALVTIFIGYELIILLSSINSLRSCIGKISGMFFLIPQFVSLLVLILWVNADDNVYNTNVGICALGAFSWFESLTIIGWLLDGCNDRDMDILPLYPHFFGDFYSGLPCSKVIMKF